MNEWIRIETTAGESVTCGELEVTPQSRALIVRWPYGGLVWNWPLGVSVRKGEEVEQIPISNATRTGIFGAVVAGALLATLLALLLTPKK